MALAYPKLTAEAREEIACDHFTAALNDPELALKIKERMPRTLDEALRIALRLEAWVKTTKMSVREQERTDRVKQKVRASGQQESGDKKPTSDSDSGSRICKIESDLAKISTNMYKQCEELKRLISQKQRTTHELSNYSKGTNKPSVAVPHQTEKNGHPTE